MKFELPIEQGTFLKRYKRFFADIRFQNEEVTAHVPNTGSMKGCLEPEIPCRFTVSDDPKRKLKYTLQMLKTSNGWVGVNTGISNQLVWEAWQSQKIPHWQQFDGGQREVKISEKSRIDLVLWKSNKTLPQDKKIKFEDIPNHQFHFVEVKNVTLGENGIARFPDAVTERGQKHIDELVLLIEKGHSAELVFTVQREDCKTFTPADDIDPVYGEKLREAVKKGLKVSAYRCDLKSDAITLGSPLKVTL
ncbi:MAG: DNA/RNA nuclease SfsA [Bdellovibrionales bacterium]|nr:DNA/RNA nuclease SfsA [Bdellovibrionales bacterium]